MKKFNKLLLVSSLLALPAYAQKPEALHASCTITNKPVIVAHVNGKKLEQQEIDDWRVHCIATLKKETIFDSDLELGHPTEFCDAIGSRARLCEERGAEGLRQ
jgi:hypothetical protein